MSGVLNNPSGEIDGRKTAFAESSTVSVVPPNPGPQRTEPGRVVEVLSPRRSRFDSDGDACFECFLDDAVAFGEPAEFLWCVAEHVHGVVEVPVHVDSDGHRPRRRVVLRSGAGELRAQQGHGDAAGPEGEVRRWTLAGSGAHVYAGQVNVVYKATQGKSGGAAKVK